MDVPGFIGAFEPPGKGRALRLLPVSDPAPNINREPWRARRRLPRHQHPDLRKSAPPLVDPELAPAYVRAVVHLQHHVRQRVPVHVDRRPPQPCPIRSPAASRCTKSAGPKHASRAATQPARPSAPAAGMAPRAGWRWARRPSRPSRCVRPRTRGALRSGRSRLPAGGAIRNRGSPPARTAPVWASVHPGLDAREARTAPVPEDREQGSLPRGAESENGCAMTSCVSRRRTLAPGPPNESTAGRACC